MLDAQDVARLLGSTPHGARRSLGQNFVTDPAVVHEIVERAGVGPGSRVLEVGPGLGSLTLCLLEAGADVLALEKDTALVGLLGDVLAASGPGRVDLVAGDALEADWTRLLGGGGWKMVSNLPYNTAVPILIGVLAGAPMVHSIWAMVQLEVAERLCAAPGGRTIGVPSVKVAWYGVARRVMVVAPEAFTPVPRVRSAVVEIHRRPPPRPDVEPAEVFGLVEAAYAKRRKMLRSSIGAQVSAEAFALAGVDPRVRPETLDVSDWADLAAALRGVPPVREGRS